MKKIIHLSLSLMLFGCATSNGQQAQGLKGFENLLSPDGAETYSLEDRMAYFGVPGVSIAVIKNGELSWARGYGVLQNGGDEEVDSETVFSVGSVSKVGTAFSILRLVDQGKLQLDEDVNGYLTRWQIPENEFTRSNPVTLRRIMSHTAGLTVHGYADFLPNEELPSTVEILNGKYPAKNQPIEVDIPVGSQYRYSGGGTQVLQLVIEEVTGDNFMEATKKLLFQPLNMNRSSYENPLPERHGNIAKAHNANGQPVALPRGYQSMPEMAASGLWTTPTDLAKMMISIMNSYHDNDILSQELVEDMLTQVSPGDYGLGPRVWEIDGKKVFSHGGANDSYRASFRGYLDEKNGYVILTNGRRGSELIGEISEVLIKSEGL
ncbi:MAG: hypothetical protein Tsb0034_13210 [Ekhidna sp.]